MKRDKVCTHLHYLIFKALGIETTDKWYIQIPEPVYEEGDITVISNQAAYTEREAAANRPNMIIKNKTKTKKKHAH
jgi:hypothetical protein